MEDEKLTRALLMAAAADYAPILASDDDIAFSRRFSREMNKLMENPARMSKPKYVRVLQTAAAIALAIITVGALLYQVPSVRAYVQRFVVERFQTYDRFEMTSEEESAMTYWYPDYMPEGYELAEYDDSGNYVSSTYSKPGFNDIYFIYMTMDNGTFIIDNEHQTVEYTTIHGDLATIYRAISEQWCSYVIWSDESSNTLFKVFGDVDCDILIDISMEIKER